MIKKLLAAFCFSAVLFFGAVVAQQVSTISPSPVLSQLVTVSFTGAAGGGASGNWSNTSYTPSANGMYRISCYEIITTAATSSSTLPNCQVVYIDEYETAVQPLTLNVTSTSSANTVGTLVQGSVVITVQGGDTLTMQGANFATSGDTPMAFQFTYRIEFLGFT